MCSIKRCDVECVEVPSTSSFFGVDETCDPGYYGLINELRAWYKYRKASYM